MTEKETIERKALLHRQAAELLRGEVDRHEQEADALSPQDKGSAPEFDPYFKVGISDEYILIRDDFPMDSISPGDFKKLLLSMFKKNDEVRQHGK